MFKTDAELRGRIKGHNKIRSFLSDAKHAEYNLLHHRYPISSVVTAMSSLHPQLSIFYVRGLQCFSKYGLLQGRPGLNGVKGEKGDSGGGAGAGYYPVSIFFS